MTKITLRQAREIRGLTEQEVSEKTGIPIRTLQRWEKDSSKMRFNHFVKLIDLYCISSNYIHIGAEDDFLRAGTAPLQPNESPFKGMPDHVIIAAVAGADGMYGIHVKVSESGDYETFQYRLSLNKALALVNELLEDLNLPKEAALMNINKAVLDTPDVTNRRLKRYFAGAGVSV